MGWLDKIFGTTDEEEETKIPDQPSGQLSPAPQENQQPSQPPFAGLEGITFGRYTDNNKSYEKAQRWHAAETLFEDQKYFEAVDAFFDYLLDEAAGNVTYQRQGERFSFSIIQGTKMILGACDDGQIVAHASMAVMETPGTAIMRRLLSLNDSLYYTRCAMDETGGLCMIFDTDIASASPNKLYYGLRELATKADRQDDSLLADFPTLQPTPATHLQPLPHNELEVKYTWFLKWVQEVLDLTASLNTDAFAGAIAYQYLAVLYRIDFLLAPEGRLQATLERISALYWKKKEEVALVERNKKIREAFVKLLSTTRQDFAEGMFRTTGTFSFTLPAPLDKVKENFNNSNKDAYWYLENKHPDLAPGLVEYGVMFSNYAYSMPLLLKELTTIFMAVLHAGFFTALGMKVPFYNAATQQLNQPAIEQAVIVAMHHLTDKYKLLQWDTSKTNYSALVPFLITFSAQMAQLNLEVKK